MDLADWFEPDLLAHAADYREPRHWVLLARMLTEAATVLLVAFTSLGGRLTNRIVDTVGVHRPGRAAGAVAGAVLVLVSAVTWPYAFLLGYVREGQFGFRTHGFGGWMADWFLAHAPVWLLGAAGMAVVYWLVGKLPNAWPAVVALGGVAAAFVGVFVAPLLVEPLRFTFTPLDDPAVETAVTAVVDDAELGIEEILVADASRRTTKHNAYVSGLGASKRLVLYDTLIDDAEPQVVALIVAHELGHIRNADVLRGTLLGSGALVVAVHGIAAFVRWRSRRGHQETQSDPRSAAVLVAVMMLLVTASAPAQMAVSRQLERAADHASLELTDRPDVYLELHTGLAEQNLGAYDTPGWARAWWASHPGVRERLTMGVEWDQASSGADSSSSIPFVSGSRR